MNRYETVSDLLGRVTKLESDHLDRQTMHEQDHALWRLEEYVLDEIRHNSKIKQANYPAFTSNAPRTLSRAVLAMLNKNGPRIMFQMPPDVSPEEADRISNNERLIYGAIYENDLLRSARADNSLQYEITWYIAHRGGVIIRPLVRPDGVATKFPVDVYDPYECVWDEGYEGLTFFTRHYVDQKSAVLDRWNFDENKEGDVKCNIAGEVECYDIWWTEKGDDDATPDAYASPRVYNAVIVGDKFAKDPTEHKELKRLPIFVVRAGGAPSRMSQMPGDGQQTWRKDQFEGIYTSVRQTIAWINRAATLYSLYLRDGAIGPWVYKGQKNRNPGTPRPFQTIRINPGEEFGPVGMPQMANEAKEFLGFIQNEWMKGGVSEIVFGNVPFTVSGFGMTQLRGAVEVLIGSFVKATETAYLLIAEELTSQFVTNRKRKFDVKGTDGRGKVFMQALKPSDVQRQYVIKVTLKDGMPDDVVAMGNAANQWAAAGAPRREIYERILQADDAEAWVREKRRESVEELPEVLMLTAVTDLLRAGRTESAQFLIQMLAKNGLLPQGEAAPQGVEMPQSQAMPAEIAGKGEQEGKYGGGGRPPVSEGA